MNFFSTTQKIMKTLQLCSFWREKHRWISWQVLRLYRYLSVSHPNSKKRSETKASPWSSHSLKPLPVQRPKGGHRGFVWVSLCMFVFFEYCWGKFCKPYSAILLFLGCRKKVGVFIFQVILSSQSLFESELQIFNFTSEFPVMARTQSFGCVFCYFSFYFTPADTGDLWSLCV